VRQVAPAIEASMAWDTLFEADDVQAALGQRNPTM
jgi:hypothetical protein